AVRPHGPSDSRGPADQVRAEKGKWSSTVVDRDFRIFFHDLLIHNSLVCCLRPPRKGGLFLSHLSHVGRRAKTGLKCPVYNIYACPTAWDKMGQKCVKR